MRSSIGAVLAIALGALAAPLAHANDPQASDADAAGGAPSIERLDGHGGPVRAVSVSPDGAVVLTSSFDNSVGVWSASGLTHLRWLDGHEAAVNVAIGLDGTRMLSGGDDFMIRLWNSDGETTEVWAGHKGKVMDLAVGDGVVASAGWDGWIGLWDLGPEGAASGVRAPILLKGHQAGVNAVRFIGPERQTLLSASSDGTIRRWDVATGALTRVVVEHGFGVNNFVVDEAEGWLAYGATDGAVRVFDLGDDHDIAAFQGERSPILAMALSPDRSRLAFGAANGYITVVSTATWQIEREFHAVRRGPIWGLAFLDEARVISVGLDDFAAVWPLDLGPVVALPDLGSHRFQVDPDTVSNGERQFARKCSVCHTLTPDGRRRAGPSLFGVFGRRAGALEGYVYSSALAGSDIVWSDETLDRLFDIGPDYYTPGSKMPMQRIVDPSDRADLIAYLKIATTTENTPSVK